MKGDIQRSHVTSQLTWWEHRVHWSRDQPPTTQLTVSTSMTVSPYGPPTWPHDFGKFLSRKMKIWITLLQELSVAKLQTIQLAHFGVKGTFLSTFSQGHQTTAYSPRLTSKPHSPCAAIPHCCIPKSTFRDTLRYPTPLPTVPCFERATLPRTLKHCRSPGYDTPLPFYDVPKIGNAALPYCSKQRIWICLINGLLWPTLRVSHQSLVSHIACVCSQCASTFSSGPSSK